MSAFVYPAAIKGLQGGVLSTGGTSWKVMLVNASYVPSGNDVAIDMGREDDLLSLELDATGYEPGHGGAGRLAVTISQAVSGSELDLVFSPNAQWTALGGPTNDTIGWAVVVTEGLEDDEGSVPLVALSLTPPKLTRGAAFELDFSGSGNIRFTQGS